jgi:hypothetical protein
MRSESFLIALSYGERTDWLNNVLDKGSAAIVTNGHTYEVDRPEVIPIAEATACFRPGSSACTGSSSWTLYSADRGSPITGRPDAAKATGDLPVVLPCWSAGPSDTLLMQTSWSLAQRCFSAVRQGHRLWEFSTASSQ